MATHQLDGWGSQEDILNPSSSPTNQNQPPAPFQPGNNAKIFSLNARANKVLRQIYLENIKKNTMTKSKFLDLYTKVCQAANSKFGLMWLKQGDHDFSIMPKTPATFLVVSPMPTSTTYNEQLSPPQTTKEFVNNELGAKAAWDNYCQGFDFLDFDRFCIAWYGVADQWKATNTVEDFADFR